MSSGKGTSIGGAAARGAEGSFPADLNGEMSVNNASPPEASTTTDIMKLYSSNGETAMGITQRESWPYQDQVKLFEKFDEFFTDASSQSADQSVYQSGGGYSRGPNDL